MSHLSWISDKDLHSAVNTLVKRCTKARNSAEKQIRENVVDPFSCLTVASTFNIKTQVKLLKLQKKRIDFIGNCQRYRQFSPKYSFFCGRMG